MGAKFAGYAVKWEAVFRRLGDWLFRRLAIRFCAEQRPAVPSLWYPVLGKACASCTRVRG